MRGNHRPRVVCMIDRIRFRWFRRVCWCNGMWSVCPHRVLLLSRPGNERLPLGAIDFDLLRPTILIRIGKLDFQQPWTERIHNLELASRSVDAFPDWCCQAFPAFKRFVNDFDFSCCIHWHSSLVQTWASFPLAVG